MMIVCAMKYILRGDSGIVINDWYLIPFALNDIC